MSVYDMIKARRTVRFFLQKPVLDEDLRDMVNGARCTSCAGNQQRLRFVVVRTSEKVHQVFEQTAWAALVKPRRTPTWGVNAPMAYVVVTTPAESGHLAHADGGAAIQSMQLIAWERGLGCCWMGAINRPRIHEILELDDAYEVLYVLAVGYPAESPMMEDSEDVSKLGYYLDEDDRLHVPKLCLDQVASWQ